MKTRIANAPYFLDQGGAQGFREVSNRRARSSRRVNNRGRRRDGNHREAGEGDRTGRVRDRTATFTVTRSA